MKNIWLLALILAVNLGSWCTEPTGQKDFALQLLQQGDAIEGHYQINSHIRPAIEAWLKKFGLQSFLTSKYAVLEGECIKLRIPIRWTWTAIAMREWDGIIVRIFVQTLKDIGLTILAVYAGHTLRDEFAIPFLKETFYSEAPFILGLVYSANNLYKRLTDLPQRNPLHDIVKVIEWADNTVVIKVPGLDTILRDAKRDVLPQGVWVKSEMGIPRIIRKQLAHPL